jgi:hypothetical protein
MLYHPTAEAYRQALAAGDTTGAASLLVDAHSGDYDSNLIDQIHAVSRMTRAQLNAPAPGTSDFVDPSEMVRVTTRVFGKR